MIRRSARDLRRIDLVPFRAAIAADVPLIMVSHAIYPALDARHLASQSRKVLVDLLRNRLHYNGAVVTDALEARAVRQRQSVELAAERSLVAGSDLVLLGSSSNYRPVFERLRKRALVSPVIRRALRDAAARVLVLKSELGLRLP